MDEAFKIMREQIAHYNTGYIQGLKDAAKMAESLWLPNCAADILAMIPTNVLQLDQPQPPHNAETDAQTILSE